MLYETKTLIEQTAIKITEELQPPGIFKIYKHE